MFRLRRLLPAPLRALARRHVDALVARGAWNRLIRAAEMGSMADRPMRSRNICLLAWTFPPVVTGGTYRPLALVRYGTEAGWSFTVISQPFPRTPSAAGTYLAEQVPARAQVIRTKAPTLRPSEWALPALDGGALNVLQIWKSAEATFHSYRPELVFATGPPFHSFVAGKLLASVFDVPLVLEYRDEWTECPFGFVRAGQDDRSWEAECLRIARLVVFTTSSQLEHQLTVFSELDRERCVVVPNGWEPGQDQVLGIPASDPAETGCHVISFTGNLGDHSLPERFLDTLAEVVRMDPSLSDRFKFRFVGQKSRRAREQLDRFPFPGMIEPVQQVPKDHVIRILRGSEGLLVFNGPRFTRYIPGKLYEYLAAGRPILVFGEGGEIERLVRRFRAGLVVPTGDARSLADALARIEATPRGTTISPQRAEWLQRHTRQALAQQTVELLRHLREGQTDDRGVP